MTSIFVAGSLSIKRLHPDFAARLSNIVTSNFDVLIGDASGADSSIQKVLVEKNAEAVTVFCSGLQPRNNLGSWPVQNVFPDAEPGTRAYYMAKDLEMAKVADYGLMLWDSKSPGTLSNVIALLESGKKSVVFVNKDKTFVTVSDPGDLRRLISVMSESAKTKAEEKIGLSARIRKISHKQYDLTL